MNTLPPSPVPDQALAQADAVLHRYFVAEQPRVWPSPPAVTPRGRSRFRWSRHHLALAASLLVAVVGWWACGLTGGTAPEHRPGVLDAGGSPPAAARRAVPRSKTVPTSPQLKSAQPAP